MTQKELVAKIAAGKKVTQPTIALIVKEVFQIIKTVGKNGGEVRITDFGSFKHNVRVAKMGWSPKLKEKIQVEAKEYIKFKPSKNILK